MAPTIVPMVFWRKMGYACIIVSLFALGEMSLVLVLLPYLHKLWAKPSINAKLDMLAVFFF